MTLLDLVLLGLASHRIWMLWFYSKFTEALRAKMQARGGWWANLATCQFCISVWSGIAGTVLYAVPGGWYVNVALAAGGLVFFAAPIQALIEATVQRTQAETARLRAGK